MKTSYLAIAFCFFLSTSNSQDKNTEIVKAFIENFNKKDSIATLNNLHKNFSEYWQSSIINQNKKEYSNHYSWGKVMQDFEEIEIISVKGEQVVVNSTYYSDLDKLLGKLPYKCKKTYVISNGKILKIISTKSKGYDYYQNKRKSAFIKFKNWLSRTHKLKRNNFKMNNKDAVKMKKIVLGYLAKDEIVERD